jgi:hypothetical protein
MPAPNPFPIPGKKSFQKSTGCTSRQQKEKPGIRRSSKGQKGKA